MRADDVAGLASRHGIDDVDGLKEALFWAGLDLKPDDAPDTLDEIEAPAIRLLMLLHKEVNQRRIVNGLLDEFHPEYRERPVETPSELIDEVGHKFDEMLRRLDAVRLVARGAHQRRGRGRPVKQHGLHNAYGWLAAFWKRAFGEAEFRQPWTDVGGYWRETAASCFLYDAMGLIDPNRPRLKEELRALMAGDVSEMAGPRRGRKGTSERRGRKRT